MHLDQLRMRIASADLDFSWCTTSYLTHGIHPYPAKFIPQIPKFLIEELSYPGETIADIFCGSGTTLVEALLLGRNTIGVDANPLACLVSQAKTTRFRVGDKDQLHDLAQKVEAMGCDIAEDSKGMLWR